MHSKNTAPEQSGEPLRTPDGRPTFTVTLRSKPGIDGNAALQALLKAALRSYGLRCRSLKTRNAGGELWALICLAP